MRYFFFIFLLLPFCCLAQEPFIVDHWLNESNAPVKVNDIVKDDKGYIWLGTDIGVFRFNGRTFIPLADSVRRPVTALALGNGQIFVGYENGLVGVANNNSVNILSIRNARPTSLINGIYTQQEQVLWLSTEDGLYLIAGGVGIHINQDSGLSDNFVYQLAGLSERKLLAATDIGINEVSLTEKGLSITHLADENGLPDNIVKVIKPFPGIRRFWIGMQQKGLAFYDPTRRIFWQPEINDGEKWHWGQVNDIYVVDDTRAWVGTEEGFLLKISVVNRQHIEVQTYHLKDKKIKGLERGRSGILWVATSHGLSWVSDEYMGTIPLKRPYSLSEIRSIACDEHNNIWFSQGVHIYRVVVGQSDNVPELVTSLPADVTSLYIDDQMRVWIGTFGKGLWYWEEGRGLIQIEDIESLQEESILDVAGTDDRLWVSGLNGVLELSYPSAYTRKVFLLNRHKKDSGIGSDYVYQLYPDRKGRIWMATDGAGVRVYDEGRYRKWDASSGFRSKVVYNITQDGFGNIWVVSLYDGLYRFDGKRWERISKEQGLQDVNISTIAANATGQVIAVHAKGIDVWYPYSNQFRTYNKRQGFGIDSNSAVLKLAANDTAGNVYIPYENGLIVFKNIQKTFDIRSVVNLYAVSVFFEPVPEGKNTFKHNQNHISFHFDAASFANAEQLRYRYKLEGYSASWIVTNDESVTFPKLGTGNYTFRVQASLNNNWTKFGEASYQFTIEKPFWLRTWFIILAVLAVLGITYLYINGREKNLRKLSMLQRERMLFEYEHLKSQVNPHFLFNSLNTLTNLIDENTSAAMDYTVRLSDLYRNMLSFRDKDLILLREEWDILENYLYIQKSRFGDALQMKVDIPEAIKQNKKIVPLALQLLVENAIKHNVVSKAKPLTISISATENSIIIVNPLQPKLSKEKGAGLGLINIRKRYSLLSKKQINYGVNENNEFVVKLPLI